MRAGVGALLGYLALVLFCAGASASIPATLMGIEQSSAWAFNGLFVVGVWLASILTGKPIAAAVSVGVLCLAGSLATSFAIQWLGLKELWLAYWLEGKLSELTGALLVNPVQLWSFLLGVAALLAGLWIVRVRQRPFGWLLPLALFVSVVAITALDVVCSLLGLSRVLDTTDILVVRYLLPLAGASLAVLVWLSASTYLAKRKAIYVGQG